LITYQIFRPMFLKGIGLPPHHAPEHDPDHEPTPEQVKQAEMDEYQRTRPLTRVDWQRMAVIIILAVFAIAFWVAFEQAGSSLNLFAKNQTDREVQGFEFPATWYQSINPAAIVIFAPVFAWLWVWLGRRGWEPSTPVKFAIGLMLLSVAYVVMIFGAFDAGNPVTLKLDDAPAAVKTTIVQQAGTSEIEKITELTWETEEKFYVAEWTENKIDDAAHSKENRDKANRGGENQNPEKAVRILTDATGKLLNKQTNVAYAQNNDSKDAADTQPSERRVTIDQVPAPVRAQILQQAGDGEPQTITRLNRNGEDFYQVEWTDNGKARDALIASTGTLWEMTTAGYEKVGRARPHYLLMLYLLVTWGELCLSPVGLSMVTKLSPARYTSVMMGLYFGTYFVANLTAGYVAAFSKNIEAGEVFTLIGGQADFFLFLFAVPLAVGLIVLALSSVIKRMMHGLH
jgi:POT family proton-dependent oligopeptide transporter